MAWVRPLALLHGVTRFGLVLLSGAVSTGTRRLCCDTSLTSTCLGPGLVSSIYAVAVATLLMVGPCRLAVLVPVCSDVHMTSFLCMFDMV